MKIEWRPVVGFEGLYEISNTGSVRSLDKVRKMFNLGGHYTRLWKGKLLSQHIDRYGYYYLGLTGHDGKRGNHTIHRLVALAFVENKDSKREVNHKDGIKTNNTAQNLEWVTTGENQRHSLAIGTHTLCKYERDALGRMTSIQKAGTG